MIRKKLFWHLVVSWVTHFRLNCLVKFFYEIQWWEHRITDELRRLSTVTDQRRFHSERSWWAGMWKRRTEGFSSGGKAKQGLGLGGMIHTSHVLTVSFSFISCDLRLIPWQLSWAMQYETVSHGFITSLLSTLATWDVLISSLNLPPANTCDLEQQAPSFLPLSPWWPGYFQRLET